MSDNKKNNIENLPENDAVESLCDESEELELYEEESGSNPFVALGRGFKNFFVNFGDNRYENYMEPEEKSVVAPKKAYTAIAVTALLSVLLFFGLTWFLSYFQFYTTGLNVNEFYDAFNAISSDSDVLAMDPNYQGISIPADARLNGNHDIVLNDGHLVISGDTRFGKIVSMEATIVDYPKYNPDTFGFDLEGEGDCSYFNYFIGIGKVMCAYETVLGTKMDPEAEPLEYTVADAYSYGYQAWYYALTYYYYYNEPEFTFTIDNTSFTFNLVENKLTVNAVKTTVMDAPEGITNFFDGISNIFTKKDEPIVSGTDTDTAVSDTDAVSGADTSSSDAA